MDNFIVSTWHLSNLGDVLLSLAECYLSWVTPLTAIFMNSIEEELENSETIHEVIPGIEHFFGDCGDLLNTQLMVGFDSTEELASVYKNNTELPPSKGTVPNVDTFISCEATISWKGRWGFDFFDD